MKDWLDYIKGCINSDLWSFVLLDFFYTKKEEGDKEDPSHFIDRVLSELPKKELDPVAFHNALLSLSVHLLGNSFSDILAKSVNFITEVKDDLNGRQMEKIISQYDTYGKRELFIEKLKASKVKFKDTVIDDTKQEQVMGSEKSPRTSQKKAGVQMKGIKQNQIIIKDKDKPFDLGIVIALKEEFREFFPEIKRFEIDKDPVSGRYYYLFEQPCKESPPYRCVASFVGDKGEKKAALVTDHIIRTWKTKTIVVIGIGASMNKDVAVGDVVVAKQVDSYIEDSKAVVQKKSSGKKKSSGFSFKFGGEVYRASGDLIKFVQNFEFIKEDLFQSWMKTCSKNLKGALSKDEMDKLLSKKILHEFPKLLDGNIASGPTVGAAEAFTEWLKNRDRNYYVLEMESGGILTAIYDLIDPSKSLVLRGVSDYGDERKKKLDQIKDGVLRRYAMHNAIQLLWFLLEAGALPRASQ